MGEIAERFGQGAGSTSAGGGMQGQLITTAIADVQTVDMTSFVGKVMNLAAPITTQNTDWR